MNRKIWGKWVGLLVILFFTFQLTATIQFKDGKFDILVKIEEDEAEDLSLIDRIVTEMQNASKYLWDATKGQHQFGTVKILIPKKWSDQAEYKAPTNENSNNAQITIGSKFEGAYNQGGTENIFVNPSPKTMQGDGRVIIHEFGHAFYKLGDEYCNYSGGKQIYKINGIWLRCTEAVEFVVDPEIPIPGVDPNITAESHGETASIMWVQWVNSIVDFCNKDNHYKTPNTDQNETNGKKSCQETMEGKFGFKQTGGTSVLNAVPTIIKIKDSGCSKTALVIDSSGSMAGIPLAIAKIAAKLYVQFSEENNYIGVVEFNTAAKIVKSLTKVTSQSKSSIQGAISGITSNGSTSIGDGLVKGRNIVESTPGVEIKKNIIVFSDGEENTAPYIADVKDSILSKGIAIYGIGLGNIGSSNDALRSLCDNSGGVFQSVPDYTSLPKVFNDIHCRVNPDEVVVFNSRNTIDQGATKTYEINIDSSISDILKFSLNEENAIDLQFTLSSPTGVDFNTNYTGYTGGEGFKVYKIDISQIEFGKWVITVANNSPGTVNPTISVISKSSIKVNAAVAEKEVVFPAPIHISGSAVDGGLAIRKLNVYAEITTPANILIKLPLNDNGINGDKMLGDGCYEGEFYEFDGDGNYSITVIFNNNSNSAALGALFADNMPWRGKEIQIAAQTKNSGQSLGNFSRQINCPSVTISGYDPYYQIPPGKIDSLFLTSFDAKKIALEWIAPGEKGYVGKATSYEMRYSTAEINESNFTSATSLSGLPTPKEVGTAESVIVDTPGNNVYYFAIRAKNKDNVPGKISNTLTVSMLLTLDTSVKTLKSWLIRDVFGEIVVNIGDLSQANVSKMILYRKDADTTDAVFEELIQISLSDVSNGKYIYNDRSFEKGKKYTYKVSAVNAGGKEIMSSNLREITF